MTNGDIVAEDQPLPLALLASIATVLASFTVAIYAPTLQFDFIRYDDPNYVWLHPRISQGLTWDNIRWAMTAFEVGNWHPVTLISHMADVSLFGLRPGAHHFVNAVLHAGNVVLLFALLVAGTRRPFAAAAVALLFAVHPLNVESVAWISQRKSVLAMGFILLAMHAHVAWVRHGGAFRYAGALLAFAAALASKPIAVVLPGLLVLLDAWPLGRLRGTSLAARLRCASVLVLEKAPYAVLAVAASVVTLIAQRGAGAVGTLESSPPATRVANALFAYAWYPFRMLWPADLSLFYPTTLGPAGPWRLVAAALLLVVLTALAMVAVRRAPYVAFGAAWYAIGLIPVAGFVQFGTQIVADRYAYLPMIGLFVAVAYAGADLLARWSPATRGVTAVVGAAIVIALVAAQHTALAPWRDSESILGRGVRRAPDNPHALTNLGLLLVNQDRFDEGIALLKRAEAIIPLFPPIHVNLGHAYVRQGQFHEARAHYEEALRLGEGDQRVVLELGGVLARLGETAAAEARLREAVALDPESVGALVLLGTLLHTQGRSADALPLLEKAVAIAPDDARVQTALGLALEAVGRREAAITALREAVRLDPAFDRATAELDRIEAGRAPALASPL